MDIVLAQDKPEFKTEHRYCKQCGHLMQDIGYKADKDRFFDTRTGKKSERYSYGWCCSYDLTSKKPGANLTHDAYVFGTKTREITNE